MKDMAGEMSGEIFTIKLEVCFELDLGHVTYERLWCI